MPRAAFSFQLTLAAPPDVVWERLWDLDRHTAAVPLTTVAGGPLGAGARFTGRTGLGPLGFDDDMVVREWDPPRRAVVDKVGKVLRGAVTVTLRPTTEGTLVRWHQTYGAALVPDRLAALARPAVRTAYLLAVRRITGA
ncbi:SRPBCC family protein [Ornithinimicrobium avium]|uniref:SRPBCC family protein n=1 Tax=Ornithinimicrobium avium TaxID=2283195 RepID=A0A345NPX7_9MICO|nr:SRPBCC family protein [Ornithinimicrobium avium]AXH97085.1 hypothetical protein DV701_14030 [Ornithinimicrobium avium]